MNGQADSGRVATPELDLTALERQVVPLLGQPFLEIASQVGISADDLSSAMGSLMDKFAADPSPDGTDEAQLLDHLLTEHGVKARDQRLPPREGLLIAHGFKHALLGRHEPPPVRGRE